MTTDPRPVLLSHDMIEAIDHGARFLTTLAALERAWMLGDEDALASIFDGIDPIEVQLTASTLHSLTFLWDVATPIRGGTTLDPIDGTVPPAVGTRAVESGAPDERPSAPVLPLDPYSRKAPCA